MIRIKLYTNVSNIKYIWYQGTKHAQVLQYNIYGALPIFSSEKLQFQMAILKKNQVLIPVVTNDEGIS